MDEKKRIAKGIKLNASQLPLSNKADFVIGADSRKVLDNKIIENLGGGSHGYFPSTVGRDYKSWSVSRELDIPSQPAEAEDQMRMIEGASAAEPLQNDVGASNSDPFFTQTNSSQAGSDPFFMAGDETNPFAHEPKHAENLLGTPAADPALAAKLVDTYRETLPRQTSEAPSPPQRVDADAPSPWSGPVADSQTPAVIKQPVAQNTNQEWTESPWAGPEMASQPATEQNVPDTVQSHQETWVPDQANQSQANQSKVPLAGQPSMTPPAQPYAPAAAHSLAAADVPGPESDVIPSWMSAMASDATTGSEAQDSSEAVVEQAAPPAEEQVELETFLNSIPDEEFIIDNETMRNLFSSLCEPKTNSLKTKSPARAAADLAIAAAAAEILSTEISIDEISIEDIATEEVLAAEGQTDFGAGERATPSEADFEAIQKAYAMLDLSPLPVSKRKEGTLENVFNAIEKAAEEQVLQGQQDTPGASGTISRSERGTIEMAIHAGGRQLIPHYNFCGMLTGVDMSDGLSFRLSEEKNTWEMIEQSGKVMVSGIQSVSFDKHGNLGYVTKRGDTVTLKVDGTIDTKFAKKAPVVLPAEPATPVPTSAGADEVNAATKQAERAQAQPTEKMPTKEGLKKPTREVPNTPTKEGVKKPTKEVPKTPTREVSKGTKPSVEAPTKPAAKTPSKPAAKTPAKPITKSQPSVKKSKSDAKPESKAPKPQQQKVRQKQTKKGR